jgi:hypothetical protein
MSMMRPDVHDSDSCVTSTRMMLRGAQIIKANAISLAAWRSASCRKAFSATAVYWIATGCTSPDAKATLDPVPINTNVSHNTFVQWLVPQSSGEIVFIRGGPLVANEDHKSKHTGLRQSSTDSREIDMPNKETTCEGRPAEDQSSHRATVPRS